MAEAALDMELAAEARLLGAADGCAGVRGGGDRGGGAGEDANTTIPLLAPLASSSTSSLRAKPDEIVVQSLLARKLCSN